jgi:hypothetical protein
MMINCSHRCGISGKISLTVKKTTGRIEFIDDTDRAARIEELSVWWIKHKGNIK